ncbi:unnamed protein product [Ceratitis capitata]|uniref:(Mediterranean fruit fly) hypothetical protein n=1 Tax=Ceratitis capitata TaxID=7213 RepID=A0A811UVW2_CERCA|nr:unnamed protein product [Ceratitis capitata]
MHKRLQSDNSVALSICYAQLKAIVWVYPPLVGHPLVMNSTNEQNKNNIIAFSIVYAHTHTHTPTHTRIKIVLQVQQKILSNAFFSCAPILVKITFAFLSDVVIAEKALRCCCLTSNINKL